MADRQLAKEALLVATTFRAQQASFNQPMAPPSITGPEDPSLIYNLSVVPEVDTTEPLHRDQRRFSHYLKFIIGVVDCRSTAPKQQSNIHVASIELSWVDRPKARKTFYRYTRKHATRALSMVTDLFDRCGYLKHEHINEHFKGTGVWGEELGEGPFLWLTFLNVNSKFRGKGIGTGLLKRAIDFAIKDTVRLGGELVFVDLDMVYPYIGEKIKAEKKKGPLVSVDGKNPEAALEREICEKAAAFFRKSGFRRVGTTNYFCFTTREDHPSKQLAAEDDHPISPMFHQRMDTNTKCGLLQEYILYKPQSWAVDTIKKDNASKSKTKIDFMEVDYFGRTALHLAAARSFKQLTMILLKKAPQAVFVRDVTGRTPWDVFRKACFRDRHLRNPNTESNSWAISRKQLLIAEALHKAMGTPIDKIEVIKEQLRHGCDCEQCFKGRISRRMFFDLSNGAKYAAYRIRTMLKKYQCSPIDNCITAYNRPVEFLPFALRIYPAGSSSFYTSFACLLDYMATILESEKMPSFEECAEHEPAQEYFFKGGNIKFAYSTIFHNSEEHVHPSDLLSPPYPQYSVTHLAPLGFTSASYREKRNTLPQCTGNDCAFDRPRRMTLGKDNEGKTLAVGPFHQRLSGRKQPDGFYENTTDIETLFTAGIPLGV